MAMLWSKPAVSKYLGKAR